ncbi:MAG: hypothetical protein JWM04_1021 [Verrucomicrobiales bacterium]|jgi:hypothetical protein|nr:hypothetical protein [Verrucomicrobiales bacterium]
MKLNKNLRFAARVFYFLVLALLAAAALSANSGVKAVLYKGF